MKRFFAEKKITQKSMAEKLGVSQQVVGALLNGRPFGKKTAKEWEDAFGISAAWLLTGTGVMVVSERADLQHEELRKLELKSEPEDERIVLLNRILASKDELLQANEELLQAKEELLQSKEALLKEREVRLKEKDEMIGILREKIAGLESFIGEKSVPVASSTQNATGIPVQGLSTRSGL